MSDLNDIYSALASARHAADSLSTWVQRADARDWVRGAQREIEQGFAALERLQRDIREGRKHVEPPEDYVRTACYCSEPTCSPPCSYCTTPRNDDEEEE